MTLPTLKRLAQLATPGNWIRAYEKDEGHIVSYDVAEYEDGALICTMQDANQDKNQQFIAACSPQTILALIELAEDAHHALSFYHDVGEGLNNDGPSRLDEYDAETGKEYPFGHHARVWLDKHKGLFE